MVNFNNYSAIDTRRNETIETIRANYLAVVPNKLNLHSNCYWNQNIPLKFSLWGSQERRSPSFGKIFNTFSEWQTAGYDSNSLVEEPALNQYKEATSNGCRDKGWRLPTGSLPTATPSRTPIRTPTPTLAITHK